MLLHEPHKNLPDTFAQQCQSITLSLELAKELGPPGLETISERVIQIWYIWNVRGHRVWCHITGMTMFASTQ